MEAERGEVEQPLRMVGGDGEHSYALNSWHQSKAIINAKTILESAIEDMYKALLPLQSFTVVDLGCSSGPNTLLVVSQVLNIISELHTKFSDKAPLPEIQFFLNDLPRNDFNSVFQSLENFKKKTEEEKGDLLPPYYIAGVPGSFHGRLFPSSTVHFFHSSYSLTWLSQAPSLQGIPPNRGNIYISKTSPPEILKAYREQFKSDFSRFLESRYEELSGEGRMVLTLIGQNHVDDDLLIYTRELLSEALNSMAIEGIISKEKLDAFNLPLYAPLLEEMKSIILSESSFFHLEQAQLLNYKLHEYYNATELDTILDGKTIANSTRAVVESLIVHQFGSEILDELFERYAEKVSKSILEQKITQCIMSHIVLVLTKKAVK